MKIYRVALATLMASTALTVVAPAMAAEGATAAMQQQIQILQDQLRQLQQQLDGMKAAEQQTQDAVTREAKERIASDNAINNAPPPKTVHPVESGAHKFSIESADGQYSIAVTGRVHLDAGGYLNFKPESSVVGTQHLASGVNARRARIGVTGKIAGDWTYNFIYDGGNSQDTTAAGIQSAQITYTGIKDVIIDLPGYSEPPFSLETATSSNDIVFMERATPSNLATGLNAGDFRANTGIRFIGDRYWVGAYFTGPQSSNDSHTNTNERFGAFQRASFQALTGPNYSVHIGAGIDELIQAPNAGPGTASQITLSDRPELRIDPTALLSTGALGSVANPVTGGMVYNGEFAAALDSLFVQAEFDHYKIQRRGLPDNNFEGAYVMAVYTLTGEHRSYNRATGAYGSITPAKPFSLANGGFGAWEIAARVSYANLRDYATPGQTLPAYGVNGGLQTNYTLGMNWYPNAWMRFMVNWIHSDIHKFNTTAITGAGLGVPVGYALDALAVRTQLSW